MRSGKRADPPDSQDNLSHCQIYRLQQGLNGFIAVAGLNGNLIDLICSLMFSHYSMGSKQIKSVVNWCAQ